MIQRTPFQTPLLPEPAGGFLFFKVALKSIKADQDFPVLQRGDMKKVHLQPKDYIALSLILAISILLALGYDGYLRAALIGIGLAYGDIVMPKIGGRQ